MQRHKFTNTSINYYKHVPKFTQAHTQTHKKDTAHEGIQTHKQRTQTKSTRTIMQPQKHNYTHHTQTNLHLETPSRHANPNKHKQGRTKTHAYHSYTETQKKTDSQTHRESQRNKQLQITHYWDTEKSAKTLEH